MLEPTYHLKEVAGWLVLWFSFIWLGGFFLLVASARHVDATEIGIALAGLTFTVKSIIVTHYQDEDCLSWPIGAELLQVVQQTIRPGQIGAW